MNQNIVACGKKIAIGAPVILWDDPGGFICPHKRGRSLCTQHDPSLNEGPTQEEIKYRIQDLEVAYQELTDVVYQFILHYDACFCSWHCHQILRNSSFLGSHFYLDLDGTIYQTCDLYWKTNSALSDDRMGNLRSIHIELSNLSWEARVEETSLPRILKDQYQKQDGSWRLILPEEYREKIRNPSFIPFAAREDGERGFFSQSVNGKVVNMWDYTEEQYRSLIQLCFGIHKLLPRIELKIPYDEAMESIPLDRIDNYSDFCGILGHAHIQSGQAEGIDTKYDPGSAMDWDRLRRAFEAKAGNI